MQKCTCLEVHGEDPDCTVHGEKAVIARLRSLAAAEHDDLSVGDDAADLIEDMRERLDAQLAGHRWSAREATERLVSAKATERAVFDTIEAIRTSPQFSGREADWVCGAIVEELRAVFAAAGRGN